MKLIKEKKIAIIGGGPAGLTLARLIQMRGATVTVFERDKHKDARPKGATLDLHHESGLRAIREMDLKHAFLDNYRPGADKLKVLDKHATVLWEDDDGDGGPPPDGAFSPFDRPEIDRGPLQQILLDSLTDNTVVWDHRFMSMEATGPSWMIHFENGNHIEADIVIAADGANSRVRKYVTDIAPFYAGVTAIEGAVHDTVKKTPAIHNLVKGGKLFVFGDSQSLIVSAKGDGSLVFYPSFNSPEDWVITSGIDFADKLQVLGWFRKSFDGWNPIFDELFLHSSGGFIARPQYCFPFDQQWESLPGVTLMGDAAHLMPPFAGEGVNMAMLDAVELAACLLDDSFNDLRSAISAYEISMRSRASETARFTMENTRILHSPAAADYMLRLMQHEGD